jgi:glycosyltransferase involved in cell wall biosynthesis
MKILFISSFPLGLGGYPNQLREILKRIQKYDKSIELGVLFLNSDMEFSTSPVNTKIFENKDAFGDFDCDNIKCFPSGGLKDIWKKTELIFNVFNPDTILYYYDIHMCEPFNISKLKCKFLVWLPVHDNFEQVKLKSIKWSSNERCKKELNFLPLFDKIATFSNFGMEVLKSYNYNPVFINHCVDKNVFYKKYSKEETRKEFNIPQDSFVCLINAKNNCPMDRKAFIEQINAFNAFSENKNTLLLLKTNPTECLNLTNLLTKKTKILNKCFSIDTVVKFYCMSDVLLSASKSEGFGIPIVEAQFCGLPVITSNCTAMPENTYNGICTEPSDVSLKVNGLNSWSDPSVDNIKSAIEKIYSGEYTPREFDKEKYNNTFEDWKAFLDI